MARTTAEIQADLTILQTAKMAWIAGTRAKSVSIGGKQIQYADMSTDYFSRTESDLTRELRAATTPQKRSFVLTSTSKGL